MQSCRPSEYPPLLEDHEGEEDETVQPSCSSKSPRIVATTRDMCGGGRVLIDSQGRTAEAAQQLISVLKHSADNRRLDPLRTGEPL